MGNVIHRIIKKFVEYRNLHGDRVQPVEFEQGGQKLLYLVLC